MSPSWQTWKMIGKYPDRQTGEEKKLQEAWKWIMNPKTKGKSTPKKISIKCYYVVF